MQTVYLSSEIPLGRHGEAVKYLLRLRGNAQLFSRSNFSLWSLANHRLQARQILRHEEPDEIQMELLDLLDTGRPDIRICADTMKMTAVCAAARKLIKRQNTPTCLAELLQDTADIARRMHALLSEMEQWTATAAQTWQPKLVDARIMTRRPREYRYSADHPLAHLYCAKLIAYPDVWLAFIWGFHAACQIITRETFIAVLEFQARTQGREPDHTQAEVIAREREMVERLAASIVGAFPALMGFTNGAGEEDDVHPQGLMAGRCLALFAMEVIHKAKYARFEHKDTAVAVVRWMSASYVLD